MFRTVILSLSLFLIACGDSNNLDDSLFTRTVEQDSSLEDHESSDSFIEDEKKHEENITTIKTEEEEALSEERVTLRSKILQNSNVSPTALDNAFEFYERNKSLITKKNVMTIFDIEQHSGQRRFYIINLYTGEVRTIHVAHGKNSDTNHDGYATAFSNTNGSNQSSLGFMLTAETYYGGNGYSLKLDGLESRNSRVRQRYIVIHGADYVNPNYSKMGRSYGCPAVSRANNNWVINTIKGGSLLYIYNSRYDG